MHTASCLSWELQQVRRPGAKPHLPGLQFFVYKQIAANNAARVTDAFLQNWPASDYAAPWMDGSDTHPIMTV